MKKDQLRLNAVSRFKQLDKDINADITSLVDLVARICDAPIALITLIDEDTQWFKASQGIDMDCIDRKLAFCNYTIKQDDLMVVHDALADERFAKNPLVTGEPYIRFYAGSTLTTKDGHAIGSLCVLDHKPRTLTDHQLHSLKILSKQAMNLMELNWSFHVLKQKHDQTQVQKKVIEESELKLKAVFNSSKDTHILVGKDLAVMAYNKAAADFVKNAHKKTIKKGVSIMEYSDPNVVEGLTKLFEQAFGGKTIKMEWLMRPETRYARWKELQLLPIRNSAKEVIGVALNSTDVTERKAQEDEINTKNAALTRIAIIQSHELRRPVASLLGLLALVKMDSLTQYIDYFDMIELTINELDEKIRGIVNDSEITLNVPMPKMAIVA